MNYPWHQGQWQCVKQRWEQDRFPHAWLLIGSQGMGKHAFARELSRSLLCENKAEFQACGTCTSCQWFDAGTHPDWMVWAPEEKGGSIKIETIRENIPKLAQTPQQSARQVVMIESAESMNRSAANALLKTLEEPTGSVVFLLVANQVSTLPATVLSRCVKLYFTPPDHADAAAWLLQAGISESQVPILLEMADRAPLRALAYHEQGYIASYQECDATLRELLAQRQDPLVLAQQWIKQGIHKWLELAVFWMQQQVYSTMGLSPVVQLNGEPVFKESLQALRQLKKTHHLYWQVHQVKGLNTQLALEEWLFSLSN